MLTQEENELLTRVGPGTRCGALLRYYWHPVAFAQDLTDEKPTHFVRLLGEDLVLFKDKSGRVGLLADHCPHRGASLLYGRVEERGIACAYHGWLYDTWGNCLETPAEPADSLLHRSVKHRAYPVQKFIGCYWAYLGPPPAPVIPRYDVWVRKDGRRHVYVGGRLNCNWLQTMENAVDVTHTLVLHQEFLRGREIVTSTTRGLLRRLDSFDFSMVPYGIMKSEVSRGNTDDDHPLIFPTILRQGNETQIRVPVDDTHTTVFKVRFFPTDDGSLIEDEEPVVDYVEPHKDPPDAPYPVAQFRMDKIIYQDYMAWETAGQIFDRSQERLGTSDKGVVLLREVLRQQIECVQRGEEPMGVVRDPDHPMIDTNLSDALRQMRERESPQLRPDSESRTLSGWGSRSREARIEGVVSTS